MVNRYCGDRSLARPTGIGCLRPSLMIGGWSAPGGRGSGTTQTDAREPWSTTIPVRDVEESEETIAKVRVRLDLAETCRTLSCYEARREGIWLDGLLTQMSREDCCRRFGIDCCGPLRRGGRRRSASRLRMW